MTLLQIVILIVCLVMFVFALVKRVLWAALLIGLVIVLNHLGVIEFMYNFVNDTLISRPANFSFLEYLRTLLA